MTLSDDVSGGDLGCWALAGLGPAGRFLLQRWCLRQDFPLVAICADNPTDRELTETFRLPVVSSTRDLLQDPRIDGLILTAPLSERSPWIRAALSAGKRLLVEGSLCDSAEQAARHERESVTSGHALGVFHVRRADPDFYAARAAVSSGRMGSLHDVRWIDGEYCLPAGTQPVAPRPRWQDVLAGTGPLLFEQLVQLTETEPLTVHAWPQPETAGYQARISYPGELSVWIDVQRASLSGLRTGWVLEGTAGAYRAGQLITLAEDGELRVEDVPLVSMADEDVMADLRRLATGHDAARASLRRSVQATVLRAAIQQAAELGQPVRFAATAAGLER